MINKILSFSTVALGLSLVACSGNGTRVSGKQCTKRFDPVPMNIPAQTKVSLKPKNLPDGTYNLVRAQLFFKGDPTEIAKDGFQVHVVETPTKNAIAELKAALEVKGPPTAKTDEEPKTLSTKLATECFRNAKVSQEHSVAIEGISSLTVKNGVVTPVTKTVGFTMSALGEFELEKKRQIRRAASLDEVFSKTDETFVVVHGPDDYEIRSKGPGQNGTYFLSTFLHRVK